MDKSEKSLDFTDGLEHLMDSPGGDKSDGSRLT